MTKIGSDNLKIVGNTNFQFEHHYLIDPKQKELLSIVNKVFDVITEKDREKIYNDWVKVKIEQNSGVSFEKIFSYAIPFLVITTLIILNIIYWNRKLKRVVDEKTKELRSLLKSFDKNVIASKTDKDGFIIYTSEAFCKISGYSKEELIGSTHSLVRHPDTQKEVFVDMWKTLKNNKTWKGEIKNRAKDGSFFWVDIIITPECDSNNEFCGYSAIRQDITAKKEVEELSNSLEQKVSERTNELNDERKYIQSIMNSQTNIVISSDGKHLKSANKAFLKFFDVQDIDQFIQNYGNCICDTFDSDSKGELIQKMMGDQKWLDYVYERPAQVHKAKITKNQKEYIFTITADKFNFNGAELKTAVFNDITEMEEIHKHTRDSIQYASLIQGALIPNDKLFTRYFEEYFTLWEPKDIVGGDVYLFEELSNTECLLMVIDCTGHGVPGAFVTMLVKAIERQITAKFINGEEEVHPGEILSIFNINMKYLLKQESSDSISNAGFDGGIFYYNKEKGIVKFAGAETPLFYIDENRELQMIKGDRHSIGYKTSDPFYQFTEHTIEVKKGMQFYLTTDGYIDQNGGAKGIPMGKRKLKALISKLQDEEFIEQKDIFIDTLKEYQLDNERNDDVTFVGLKI